MVGDFTFTNPPKAVSLITAYSKLRAQIQVSNTGMITYAFGNFDDCLTPTHRIHVWYIYIYIIHIYIYMLTLGVYWWDPWSTIYSSTMDPMCYQKQLLILRPFVKYQSAGCSIMTSRWLMRLKPDTFVGHVICEYHCETDLNIDIWVMGGS